ncbi:hypothetical protein JOC36_000101 [Weissella uvarum]|uniref:DUF871 domain-containing protein n=1 Tax=Weissella uvarum TaxID=1479233 RepID=UPI00195F2598|nr:MupG family TIM beta-alpha barrel fold protein [Weissella uvarum]MBM7616568.1 hypothetical protein [Weissella uvarum]MCM0594972.1 DUF871 domain-containing protein [Weissella uvarum]
MHELGISIYPSKSQFDEMKAYLDDAHSLGYTRIFTSLLEVTGDAKSVVENFKNIIMYGNELGMQTTVDINPKLFKQLGITYDELGFFAKIGATTVRLDEGFTGYEEAKMTYNPYNLKIETNISRGQHYIDMVWDFGPNPRNLIGSHNFYPQIRTGLQKDYFIQTTERYKQYNLETSAFIDGTTGKVGPWPVAERMVSMEAQRAMSAASQVQLMKQINLIDNLYISSSLVSHDELKLIADAYQTPYPVLEIELADDLTAIERQIILDEVHLYRGDCSGYMIRSSQPRIKYAAEDVPAHNLIDIQPGDIVIGNTSFGQYKGELQIDLAPWENDGHYNVVGHVHASNMPVLETIKPWQSFTLIEK